MKNCKTLGAVMAASIALIGSAHAQTPELQLKASNYNTTTGVWTDTGTLGDNATAQTSQGETAATLVTGATPNGSSAVAFDTGASASVFEFATALPVSSTGYTIFVLADPLSANSGDTAQAFLGGNVGGVEYRVYQGKQGDLAQNVGGGGTGTNSYPTGFSLFDTTISSTGGTFDLNGAADGTSGGISDTAGILTIGSNQLGTGGEFFHGDIAEIDVFAGVLTSTQIAAEQATLEAEYVTTAPEPSTWAMLLGGMLVLVGVQRLSRNRTV
jgi:hypothetical protein